MDISQFGHEGSLILMVVLSLTSIYAFMDSGFMSSMIFDIKEVRDNKQYYRFMTSGFVHNDVMHLGFNLFSLYFFSQDLEEYFGMMVLFGIFGIATLMGSLFSFANNYKESQYLALGASGGVIGVIFASILVFEDMAVIMPFVPFEIPGYLYAILYLLYSQYSMKNKEDNIGHDAHIGGAISGTICMVLLVPEILFTRGLLIAGIFLPLAGFFIFEKYFSRKAKWQRSLNQNKNVN